MKSYAEYLRENGASEEDVKVMDTAIARRGYETLQTNLEAAQASAATAKTDLANYDSWYYDKSLPAYNKMQQDLIAAQGEVARSNAIIKAAQERGLLEVAENAVVSPVAAITPA